MSLEAGTKLGPYEISAPIGAGGMGEVYRAKDTRLGRDVAVKVLPAHMSSSPELRQRLEREAKTISQLSHPHICMLHDVGHQNGTDYLVMEFLEGETLADRLAKGALPVEQALRIGIEIAGALDAAHRSGIVHRDLKPGNIMLTKTGVKLLDFGLAKLAAPTTPVSQATSLPTALQESQPLTSRGTILGTFQYMSPEQLEGKEADARSDIFAFGCVLYEMVTGQKAFTGKSQASLIGSIMNTEPPPISSIQPMIPPALDRVVKGCLAKEPEHRWSTAHDVMLQLQWVAEGGSAAGLPAPVAARRKSREKLAWGVAAALLLAAGALAYGFVRRAPKPPRTRPVRGRRSLRTSSRSTRPRISPGRADPGLQRHRFGEGKTQIWVRPLNALVAQPLPGTEGTTRPFWSPDSRFIGFFPGGKLKKIDVAGGPPTKICDAPTGSDGTWSPEGVILFDGTGQRSDPPRLGRGRHAHRRRQAGRGAEGDADRLAGVSSRRPPLHLHVDQPEGGRQRLPDRLARLDGDEAVRAGADDADLRAAGLSAVRARPDARRAALRREGDEDDRRAGSARRADRDRRRRARAVLGVARRSARVPDRRVGKPPASGSTDPARSSTRSATRANTGNPASRPSGRPARVRPSSTPASNKDDIWIRDLARGVNSRFTFAPGNAFAPLWSPRRRDDRLHVGSRGSARPLREGRERPGRGEAAPQGARRWSLSRSASPPTDASSPTRCATRRPAGTS